MILLHFVTLAFLFKVFGSVPNCVVDGSRSTWLLMSEGTDSVLLIFETRKNKNKSVSEILLIVYGKKNTFWFAMNIT